MYLKIVLLQTLHLICKAPWVSHNVFLYPDHQAFTEQSALTLTQLLQQLAFSKPSLVALGRALFSPWRVSCMASYAVKYSGFPEDLISMAHGQAGGQTRVCLLSTLLACSAYPVMNASLPLGSVLVPPTLPFAEVLIVAYGAHVSGLRLPPMAGGPEEQQVAEFAVCSNSVCSQRQGWHGAISASCFLHTRFPFLPICL